jgi:hypothetical protein
MENIDTEKRKEVMKEIMELLDDVVQNNYQFNNIVKDISEK